LVSCVSKKPPDLGLVDGHNCASIRPALLGNEIFLLPGQIGDAILYFRPPFGPASINVRDIILPALPADLTQAWMRGWARARGREYFS
jgi:hypothetical protein